MSGTESVSSGIGVVLDDIFIFFSLSFQDKSETRYILTDHIGITYRSHSHASCQDNTGLVSKIRNLDSFNLISFSINAPKSELGTSFL